MDAYRDTTSRDDGGYPQLPKEALVTAPGLDLLSEGRQALEANIAVGAESSRALWNGMRAVSEELGNFFTDRVRSHGRFAEGLMSSLLPGAALNHMAEYVASEFRAWDDEQSRLLGLFAHAMTETMLEIDSVEIPGKFY